ncbi:class I SAM-dependent methyltransferase [Micromonospora sp. NBC_01813]|uniref:class I SAM-dependent methyltransferase n=1 Tax=Micromonospora sp. NBC_01813 TaxID=2975988 RepID=UPI002DDC21E7|nr:methyltransferase domain-containing protein [Micromonospora sp. NBC_01813]WSA06860.1 class I SAM-dependent methyltransferase [Micromonospora sp. NBC_01813]
MRPPDALGGWDEEDNAERYERFTRDFPFYRIASRDLVARADLSGADTVVDLCGGTGTTAVVALDAMPLHSRVITIDNAKAMHAVGQRSRTDPRITWLLANAEDAATAVAGPVDAVICNAAIWKTDTSATFAAVKRILRPGGRLAFNIGGGFAGLAKPDRQTGQTPSLTGMITEIAIRDYGYVPEAGRDDRPVLTATVVHEQLRSAGLTVLTTDVVTQPGTLEEKRAWLSIPLFARPPGQFSHRQRMEILDHAYREVDPTRGTSTQWLVVTAEA